MKDNERVWLEIKNLTESLKRLWHRVEDLEQERDQQGLQIDCTIQNLVEAAQRVGAVTGKVSE